MLRTLASLALCTAAAAQNTWIVDPNGTGNFTTLGAAIAAAAPFDVVILRGGGYHLGTSVVSKPLSILGDNTAGQAIVMDLRIPSAPWLGAPVTIAGIEVVTFTAQQPVSIEDAVIRRCTINTVASLHRCVVGYSQSSFVNSPSSFVLSGGQAIVTDSVLYPGAAYGALDPYTGQCVGHPGPPAVQVNGGDLTLAGCRLEGAWAWAVYCGGPYTGIAPPGPAVVVAQGTVRFTDSVVFSSAAQSVVHASIPVFYDPSAVFTPPLQGGTSIFLPVTRGQGALPGGAMQCDVFAAPGLPAAIAGSLGMRGPVTTSFGATWLDPNAFVVLALGVTDAAGRLPAAIPVPATAPRGLPIAVQGFVAAPTPGALQAAASVVLHVL
ncbi:MAG: hypothetical protein U1E73_13830 [Planctomycetota bacterium]